MWEESPVEWVYAYRDLDHALEGREEATQCFVVTPSGEVPAGLCPADSVTTGISRGEDRGRPHPQLVPNGLVPDVVVKHAPRARGQWAVFAEKLGVDPSEVVVVSTEARGACPLGGIDDCLGPGPHEYRLDRVVHVPSGILLAQHETINGVIVFNFEVTEIEFGRGFATSG